MPPTLRRNVATVPVEAMAMIRMLVLLVVVVLVAWALAAALGARRWQRITAELRRGLEAGEATPPAERVDLARLDGLPVPVQRYLRQVLRDGQPYVRRVRIVHRGMFDMGAERARWFAFVSEQQVTARRPGFDWNGTVRVAPGLPIRVHDAYVRGEGTLRAALLGLIDVADMRGGGAVAEGELMRWLAEAAWYPTALLPGGDVRWEPLDATSARATVADGATTVSLDFVFGDDGLLRCVRTPARGRAVGSRIVPTPWEGCFDTYREHGGMRVPTRGEVAWIVDGVRRPYWRGTVVSIAYDAPRPGPR